MLGALVFGRYATRLAPKPLLNLAVLIGVTGTLAYYGLVGWWSAVALTVVGQLRLRHRAAGDARPGGAGGPPARRGHFFAALMSVNNLGTTGAAWVGGYLYDLVGLNWLIAISAAAMAACWLLVPWVRIPEPPNSLGSHPALDVRRPLRGSACAGRGGRGGRRRGG